MSSSREVEIPRRRVDIRRHIWSLLHGWPSIYITAALALLALTAGGCGEDEPAAREADALWISGHARITENTVLPDEDAEYKVRIISIGDSKTCEFFSGRKTLAFDPDGGYAIVINARDLRSATEGCTLSKFSTQDLVSVDLDARLEPSAELCTDYCIRDGGTHCLSECTQADTRIGAKHSFATEALRKAERNESNVLILRGDLLFDTLMGRLPIDGPEDEGTDDHDHDNGDEVGTPDPGDSSPPPPPPASGLPDFTVDASAARRSLQITNRSFNTSSCAVAEGCLTGTGERRLLKFDAVLVNSGDGDFVLGNPDGNDAFSYSSCHEHYHLQSIAEYRLVGRDGRVVVTSRKQGFCMMDTRPTSGSRNGRYNCAFQGISAGWADVYGSALDCQWLDITDVDRGDYLLQIEVNPGGHFKESSRTNNTVSLEVEIP